MTEPDGLKPSRASAILVDREAFLSTVELVSQILQNFGIEVEALRMATNMNPDLRKTLLQVTIAHSQCVSVIGQYLQDSVYDPIDPDGTKGRDLN